MYKIAIGDIHGKLDMLQCLIFLANKNISGDYQKIFLGDYIDRGQDSKGVLDYVWSCLNRYNDIVLPGNHERMFIEAYEGGNPDRSALRTFTANGGKQTLQSFGVENIMDVPKSYIDFVKNVLLKKENLFYKDKYRIFVHAGISDKPVENTSEDILLWIRPGKHNFEYQEYLVVHGHTPLENIFWRGNRMDLDTGAVYGNKLSAALFNDEKKEPLAYFQVNSKLQTKVLIP